MKATVITTGPGVIIAVDGPAASGKGTIARALAEHFGLPHLDTGLLYRAVGVALERAGGDPASEGDAETATGFPDDLLRDPALRTEEAGAWASKVSAHPAVRAALLARQREFAARSGGAVLDGRDIGTVIVPDADAKLYITASARVRAERRAAEMAARGLAVDLDAMEADIRARDARDMGRANAPLARADDADLLDTTELTIDAAIQRAIALVDARVERHRKE